MTFSDNVFPYPKKKKKQEDNVLKFCTVDTLSNICNEGDLSLYLPSSWAFYIFLSFGVCDFWDGLSKVLYFTRILHDSCLHRKQAWCIYLRMDGFLLSWNHHVQHLPLDFPAVLLFWFCMLFYFFNKLLLFYQKKNIWPMVWSASSI